jgi:hypothetical protein
MSEPRPLLSTVLPLVLAAGLAGGCTVRHVPPPPPPDRVLPAVEQGGLPARGRGRILLDVEGERALVEEVSGGELAASGAGRVFSGSLEVSQRLCVTPCYVDLTPGPHRLRFVSITDGSRRANGYVNIDTGTTAYRQRLGVSRRHALRRVGGITSAILGAIFLMNVPAAFRENHPHSSTILMSGLTFGALGGWLIYTSAGVEQEGSGVQWPAAGQP